MLKTGPDVSGMSREEAREARIRFWRERVAEAEEAVAGGQTQTEFCRRQELSAGAYFWWKKVLGQMDRDRKPRGRSPRRKKEALFLPVAVRASESGSGDRYHLELALGGDRVVRVREGCDPKLLEAVLRLVGELPC